MAGLDAARHVADERGRMGLMDEVGAGPLAIDTAIFIYFIEEHPRYLSLVKPLFRGIDEGRLPALASCLTLLEVLVVPCRAGTSGSPRGTKRCSAGAVA